MTPTTTMPVTYGHDASIARFSVARYQRMIEAGVFSSDDRVELLENYMVLKMKHNPSHDGTIDLINAILRGQCPPGGWCASSKALFSRTVNPNRTSRSCAEGREPI